MEILNKTKQNKTKNILLGAGKIYLHLEHIFDSGNTYMTFEVKLLKTFVATYPLVILAKFSQNRMKHVEAEANWSAETLLT